MRNFVDHVFESMFNTKTYIPFARKLTVLLIGLVVIIAAIQLILMGQ